MRALLYDSLFQSVVLSPLAGIFLGAVIGALRGRSSPRPYQVVRKIVVEKRVASPKTRANDRGGNSAGDDGMALMLTFAAASAVALWGGMRYFEEITLGLLGFTAFMAFLTFGMHLVARVRGRPLDAWWIMDTGTGALVSGYCAWIVWWTRATMDPQLVARAKSLGPWEFVRSLSDNVWHSLPFQMTGLLFLGLLMLFITMRAVHHLSLYSADLADDNSY